MSQHKFTAAEKFACLRREIELRQKVYPRLVERGSLKEADAKHEIECMQAIAGDYLNAAANDTHTRHMEHG